MVLVFLLSGSVSASCPQGMAGDGTSENPCMITNCTQLQAMTENLSAHYKIENNINCSDTINWNGGAGFEPVGHNTASWHPPNNAFTGTFDGQGYIITNLYINRNVLFVGLFSSTNGATIRNVGLVNATVTGYIYTAGLVGCATNSTVNSCYLTGVNVTANDYLGHVGGMIGQNDGNISNCYVTGTVTNTGSGYYYHAGGLAGYNGGSIINSYTAVDINAGCDAGGLVGYSYEGTISNSYAVGTVIGSCNVGGLVGCKGNDTITIITNCGWWTGSGPANAIGNSAENVTYNQANKSDFYGNILGIYSAWDFNNVWGINEGVSYPYLLRTKTTCPAGMAGDGTSGNPCMITNCTQLQAMNENLTLNYTLNNPINCTYTRNWNAGAGFDPVGNDSNPFTGTFNGNNYVISNLYINRTMEYIGLFGATQKSKIFNIGLENISFTHHSGSRYIGGISGSIRNTTVNNVFVTGRITGYWGIFGFIVGKATSGSIINNTYALGNITVTVMDNSGGLVGSLYDYIGGQTPVIYNSYFSGMIRGQGAWDGGVGGLVGRSYLVPNSTQNSFAVAKVYSVNHPGGVVGLLTSSGILNCAWYDYPEDSNDNAVNCYLDWNTPGGTGCTKINDSNGGIAYFYNRNNAPMSSWDFNEIWRERSDGFPILRGFEYLFPIDCNCSSCEECNQKLNHTSCSIVILNASITNQTGSCIDNPIGFNSKIFDCQGHTIDGTGSGNGIYLNGKSNNTIKNCTITNFYEGIYLNSCSNSTENLNDGLVGYWSFDEGEGNVSHDLSGNGNDGTIYGAEWVDGKYEKALSFDGAISSSYINFGVMDNQLVGLNSITTSAWIYSERFGTDNSYREIIITNNVDDNGMLEWRLNGDKGFCWSISTNGITSGNGCEFCKNLLQLNKWQHAVCLWNGVNVSCYLDGQRCSNTVNTSGTIIRDYHFCDPCTSIPLYIGSRGPGERHKSWYPNSFLGNIDEVKIYNRALTESEIRATMLNYCANYSSSSNNTLTNNIINSNNKSGIYIFGNSNFNQISNNKISNNNETGITISNCNSLGNCYDGNSNNTIEGNEISNNKVGIFSKSSNSTINNNIVCGNTQLDFNSPDWQNSTGNNNKCNKPNGWNDDGATGCDYKCICNCSNCIECSEKLSENACGIVILNTSILNQNTTCINNPERFNNKIFDCQNNIISGDNSNDIYGIYLENKFNNTIRNCNIMNFYNGIVLSSSANNILTNNSINSNHVGIYLLNSLNNALEKDKILENHLGIFSKNSDSLINSNFVCDNTNSDFSSSDWKTSSGNNNTCDNHGIWVDDLKITCTHPCSILCKQYDFNKDESVDIFDAVQALEYLNGEKDIIYNKKCSCKTGNLTLQDVLNLMGNL